MAKEKILVLDDEAAIVEMVKLVLDNEGYETVTLKSSKNAINVIKKEMPDLLLLDVTMPHKDGYQLCDEIRSEDDISSIPIIIFTGQPSEKPLINEASAFYGASDFIAKPFEPEELLSKIKKNLP